jgi:hypothetical protein
MKTNKTAALTASLACIVALSMSAPAATTLIDGGFESFKVGMNKGNPGGSGWQTTEPGNGNAATVGDIEIWANGQDGVPASEGVRFAEANAWTAATLYQNVTIDSAGPVDYFFSHRGRMGVDTLKVTVTYFGIDNLFGTGDDSVLVDTPYTAGNTAWTTHTVSNAFTSVANGTYRFAYSAVSTAGGTPSVGNFIDDVGFGVGVVTAIPEPGSLLATGGMLASGLLLRRRGQKLACAAGGTTGSDKPASI